MLEATRRPRLAEAGATRSNASEVNRPFGGAELM